MIGFEVTVDGEAVATLGIGDRQVLTATIQHVRVSDEDPNPEAEAHLVLGGLDPETDLHHTWAAPTPLEMGSVVTIRVVKTEDPTPADEVGPFEGTPAPADERAAREADCRELAGELGWTLRTAEGEAVEPRTEPALRGPPVGFEVVLDGSPVATIGIGSYKVLHATLTHAALDTGSTGGSDPVAGLSLALAGLDCETNLRHRWNAPPISVGSVVTLTVLRCDAPDRADTTHEDRADEDADEWARLEVVCREMAAALGWIVHAPGA